MVGTTKPRRVNRPRYGIWALDCAILAERRSPLCLYLPQYYEKQYKAGLAEDSMVEYLRKEGVSEVALQEILTAPAKRPAPADAPAVASTPKKKKRRKKSGRRSQPSPKTPVAVPKSREQYHAAYKSAGKKMREEKMTCREAAVSTPLVSCSPVPIVSDFGSLCILGQHRPTWSGSLGAALAPRL